jgi:hypothetical protein
MGIFRRGEGVMRCSALGIDLEEIQCGQSIALGEAIPLMVFDVCSRSRVAMWSIQKNAIGEARIGYLP